ncbi:hypothetical protein LSH36_63g08029 [Paralvinella palmiformis]|uniref:Uncharacterized protein n=1 Tax=Paralvinella palmiformis TaxID=53620 RepID=A0AAD9NEQ2_9ANNE|nr:hypothetical protein LSH36_63g08029 [Paralvinella palmiformis]
MSPITQDSTDRSQSQVRGHRQESQTSAHTQESQTSAHTQESQTSAHTQDRINTANKENGCQHKHPMFKAAVLSIMTSTMEKRMTERTDQSADDKASGNRDRNMTCPVRSEHRITVCCPDDKNNVIRSTRCSLGYSRKTSPVAETYDHSTRDHNTQIPHTKRRQAFCVQTASQTHSVAYTNIPSSTKRCTQFDLREGVVQTNSGASPGYKTQSITRRRSSLGGNANRVKRRSTLPNLGITSLMGADAGQSTSANETKDGTIKTSLASVVGVVVFRKMYQSRLGLTVRREVEKTKESTSVVSSDIIENDVLEDSLDPEDVPKKPRFGATLSREAQYAILLGYEDAILGELQQQDNNVSTEFRRKIPDQSTLPVGVMSKKTQDGCLQDADDFPERRPDFAAVHTRHVATPGGGRHGGVGSYAAYKKRTLRRPNSSHSPKTTECVQEQLQITEHLEYAMDIVDKLKVIRGDISTSPRRRVRRIEPLKSYDNWTRSLNDHLISAVH